MRLTNSSRKWEWKAIHLCLLLWTLVGPYISAPLLSAPVPSASKFFSNSACPHPVPSPLPASYSRTGQDLLKSPTLEGASPGGVSNTCCALCLCYPRPYSHSNCCHSDHTRTTWRHWGCAVLRPGAGLCQVLGFRLESEFRTGSSSTPACPF
jgi:hypothetical protein